MIRPNHFQILFLCFLLLQLDISHTHASPAGGTIHGCPSQCSCTWQRTYRTNNNDRGDVDELEVQCNRYAARHDADMSRSPDLSKLRSRSKPIVRLVMEQMDVSALTDRSLVAGQRLRSLTIMNNQKLTTIDRRLFDERSVIEHLESLVIVGNPSLIEIPMEAIEGLTNLRTLKLEVAGCPMAESSMSSSDLAPIDRLITSTETSMIDVITEPIDTEIIGMIDGQEQAMATDQPHQRSRRSKPVPLDQDDQGDHSDHIRSALDQDRYIGSTIDTSLPPSCQSQISSDSLRYLKRLETLSLQGAKFKSVLTQSINLSRSIIDLSLIIVNLTDDDQWDALFGQLPRLGNLALPGNLLTYVPRSIGGLSQLRSLSIEDNRLVIDHDHPTWDELNLPASLESLDLRGNLYESFPCALITDPKLRLRAPRLRYLRVDDAPEALCLSCASSKLAQFKHECRRGPQSAKQMVTTTQRMESTSEGLDNTEEAGRDSSKWASSRHHPTTTRATEDSTVMTTGLPGSSEASIEETEITTDSVVLKTVENSSGDRANSKDYFYDEN